MEESLKGSSQENSFFNLKNKTFSSEIKKAILLKVLPRKQMPASFVPRINDLSLIHRSKTFNAKSKFNISLSCSKQNISQNHEEYGSLRTESKKHRDLSLENKGRKSPLFLEEILQKQKSKDAFKVKLEKSYPSILEILNGRWDALEMMRFEDFREVSAGLAIQRERRAKLSSIRSELVEYLSRVFLESQETVDLVALVFSEYERIADIYQGWISQEYRRLERNRRSIEEQRAREMKDFSVYCDAVTEILRTTLRISQKKESDLTIAFVNEELEKEWNMKLNELKVCLRTDFPHSDFLKTVEAIESFHGEMLRKLGDLKNEKELLEAEIQKIAMSQETNSTLKTTLDVLSKRVEARRVEVDPKIAQSLEYLRRFEEVYKRNIAELKEKNEKLKVELLNERERARSSTLEHAGQFQRQATRVVIVKKNQATQLSFSSTVEGGLLRNQCPLLRNLNTNRSGFRMPTHCLASLINLILTDKILADFNQFLENLPFYSFQNFAMQWFLTNLGNQSYASLIMNDFFANLTELMVDNDRCEIFASLCGLSSSENQSCSHFLSSIQCARIYLRIVDFTNSKIKKLPFSSPLLPLTDPLLITLDEAYKLLEFVCEGEENDLFTAKELGKAFGQLIDKRQIKVLDGRKGRLKASVTADSTPQSQDSRFIAGASMISLDTLVKFVFESFSTGFQRRVTDMVNSLKIIQSNRKFNDYYVEDFVKTLMKFFPRRSLQFSEECFREFVYGNSHHEISGLGEMMRPVEAKLGEMGLPRKFYLESENVTKEGFFDAASGIVVLNYLYESLAAKIKAEEPKNDNLYVLHEQFKKEFNRFPKNLEAQNRVNTVFAGNDAKDVIERVESVWRLFRAIVDIMFSRSDMSLSFRERRAKDP